MTGDNGRVSPHNPTAQNSTKTLLRSSDDRCRDRRLRHMPHKMGIYRRTSRTPHRTDDTVTRGLDSNGMAQRLHYYNGSRSFLAEPFPSCLQHWRWRWFSHQVKHLLAKRHR